MFTQHIPRTGNPVGKSHSVFTRVGAGVGTIVLSAGFALAAAPAANAQSTAVSYAQGQFLSGTIAGTNLANVAALQAASANNNGSQDIVTSRDPLNATVLQTVNVDAPQGVQLDLGNIIDAGAINQYAEAKSNGSSLGASGAIGDDGAIGVGSVGSGAAGDLDVDLDSLLNPKFASVLTDLKLSLNAVSAQAKADLSTASGAYTIADAKLSLSSPAISNLTDKVNQALATMDQQLASMGTDDGSLGNAVDGVLDPVLGAVGSSADVTVTVDSDAQAKIQDLLNGAYGNGAVSFNLQTGAIDVDLEKLLGGDINQLAPNTEILSDKVINKVLKGITDTVATLADQIVDRAKDALHDAKVTVHANLDLLTPQAGSSQQVCHTVDLPVVGGILNDVLNGDAGSIGDLLDLPGVDQLSDLTSVLTPTQVTQLTNALGVTNLSQLDGLGSLNQILSSVGNGSSGGIGGGLGGILGRSVYASAPIKSGLICDLVQSVAPSLHSTVNVNIVGTVDQLTSGTAATADATVSLLGGTVNAAVNAQAIVSALGTPLEDGIFGDDGSVQKLVDSLNSGLVDPAVSGLLGDTSVSKVLTDLVSVKANVQELSPASTGNGQQFTETAVRVSVLPNANTQLATLNIAQATVGPNVTVVQPPTCTNGNCTPCTGPSCTPTPPSCITNCGTTTADSRLAYTGIGIATLIAIILALLAAGAYLAREGYRRNHPKSLTSD